MERRDSDLDVLPEGARRLSELVAQDLHTESAAIYKAASGFTTPDGAISISTGEEFVLMRTRWGTGLAIGPQSGGRSISPVSLEDLETILVV